MKFKLLFFFLATNFFILSGQEKSTVVSAEISFLFLNNNVKGTLEGFSSSSQIDLNTIENSILKGSVLAETISTGNSIRNWSLKRSKYFDAKTYPRISFESTNIKEDGNEIIVTGLLKIKKTTKEVVFTFKKNDAVLEGEASIYSSDFGISVKKKREQNKVNVKITLHLE